jgi:predicted translin family RNA/ssDNA-binding protein
MLKQSSISYLFQKLSEDLSFLIEKRERLLKASRDVTYQSKKVIYLLHRAVDEEPLAVFSKAEEQLHTIRKLICDLILSELSLENYYRFHEVFTTALQEYTEARLFCAYLKENRIMTLEELNAEIAHQSEQPTEGLRDSNRKRPSSL